LMRHMPANRKQQRIELAEAMERQRLQQLEEARLAAERAEAARLAYIERVKQEQLQREQQQQQQMLAQQYPSNQGTYRPVLQPPRPTYNPLPMQKQNVQGLTPQQQQAQFNVSAELAAMRQREQAAAALRQQAMATSAGQQLHSALYKVRVELTKYWQAHEGPQVMAEGEERLAQRESKLMLLWLVGSHKLLSAIDIEFTTLSESLKLTDPSLVPANVQESALRCAGVNKLPPGDTWRDNISSEQRQATIGAIYRLLEEAARYANGLGVVQSVALSGISHRLQLYELALLCLAPAPAIYHNLDPANLTTRLVQTLTLFKNHVEILIRTAVRPSTTTVNKK